MLAIVATTPTDNARPTTTTVKIFSNMILPLIDGRYCPAYGLLIDVIMKVIFFNSF